MGNDAQTFKRKKKKKLSFTLSSTLYIPIISKFKVTYKNMRILKESPMMSLTIIEEALLRFEKKKKKH